MKLQKFLFIIIALAIISGSFYYMFIPDMKNKPTVIKIVVDKKYNDTDNSFYEDIKNQFTQKYGDISIKYVYLDDYESDNYIKKNSVDGWFALSEENIEYYKESLSYENKRSVTVQPFTYATSPMVIVGWKDKLNKLGDIDIPKLYDIVTNNKSWDSYGGSIQWGNIKFAHPMPTLYDAGGKLIVLLAANYQAQTGETKNFITKIDVGNAKDYIEKFEKNIADQPSDDSYVLDNLINYNEKKIDMVLLSESTVLKQIKNASTKWSNLKMIYPSPNIYSNVQFVMLSSPSQSPKEVDALNKFKDFVLSEDVQKNVFKKGYRPVNTNISELDNMEKNYSSFGFKKDIPPSSISYDRDTMYGVSDVIYKMNEKNDRHSM